MRYRTGLWLVLSLLYKEHVQQDVQQPAQDPLYRLYLYNNQEQHQDHHQELYIHSHEDQFSLIP